MFTIEEFVIAGDNIDASIAQIYEDLGLDVIKEQTRIIIRSSSKSKIVSLSSGIHLNSLYSVLKTIIDKGYTTIDSVEANVVLYDSLKNKIIVSFVGEQTYNTIGILTSGGDAPGMNAAIRSIVRTSVRWGVSVYGVYRGFDGLVNDYISKLGWDTETHSSAEGGTVLLSARSKCFFNRNARKKAALNLIKKGINCLIVLGGDGSLKGALTLKEEFREFFLELIKEGMLSQKDLKTALNHNATLSRSIEDFNDHTHFTDFYGEPECYKETPRINTLKYPIIDSVLKNDFNSEAEVSQDVNIMGNLDDFIYDLKIVGIPASIDNDIWGSDLTLGADTALNRVIESIDHLSSTMRSHQRVFVIEVMGRNCGWLALMSAFSCIADYVFIPECPPKDWKTDLMASVNYSRQHGKPGVFIIISEGAIDCEGINIESEDVVDYIASFGIDTRLLRLGHVQRGGPSSAFDRILGTISGIKAFEELLDPCEKSKLISYSEGTIKTYNLNDIIKSNDEIKTKQANKKFSDVFNLRSEMFKDIYKLYKITTEGKINSFAPVMEDLDLKNLFANKVDLKSQKKDKTNRPKIGILQCGTRSAGMNTALNAIIQYCYSKGAEPHYILNGFDGLVIGQITKSKLFEFSCDFNNGGAVLGLSDPKNIDKDKVRRILNAKKITSLIVIGDKTARSVILDLDIPNLIFIPAASQNDILDTDICIGTDTSLNTIIKVSDAARLNAKSMKKSVFVLEISGGRCGYLTLMGSIAAGAFECFIPERKYLLSHLSKTANRLYKRFKTKSRSGIVIFRNEKTFCGISSDSFCRVMRTDGKGLFMTDYAVIGKLQQGLYPSPIDRMNAALFGMYAVDYALSQAGHGMVALKGNKIVFVKTEDWIDDASNEPRWLKYSNICRALE